MNHGLIRYHFKDKDGLWRAAVDFLFERLHEEMKEPEELKNLSNGERARHSFHRYVHYCAKHPEHARIMVQESIRDSSRLTWAVNRYIKPDHETQRTRAMRLVQQNIYRDVPLETLNYIMAASAQSIFMLGREFQQVTGLDPTSEEVINAHAEVLTKLFFKENGD